VNDGRRGFAQGLRGRLRIVGFWLARGEIRRRVGPADLLRNVLTPRCEDVARRYVTREGEDDDYAWYAVAGSDRRFPYPKGLPPHNFMQVVSEAFLEHHWHHYEIPQTRVRDGDVVADCGSAEGFFAFRHADRCRHIFCIEPLPVFAAALRKIFSDRYDVTVVEAALAAEPGTVWLSPSSIASACHARPSGDGDLPVEAVTLDSLFADRAFGIDYLKADLEGFEEMMLRGGLETIRASRPRIAVTTYHEGQDAGRIVELVRGAVPDYRWLLKGIEETAGNPVMLHMWTE